MGKTFKTNLALVLLFILSSTIVNCSIDQRQITNEKPKLIKEKIEIEKTPEVKLSSNAVYPGEFLLIYLSNTTFQDAFSYQTPILDKEIKLFPWQDGNIAFLPIDYFTKPGDYSLDFTISRLGKTLFKENTTIRVKSKDFPVQKLNVSKKTQSLRDEKLLAEDQVLVKAAKSKSKSSPLWDDAFLLPVKGRISTEYGVIRFINDVESGRHSGIDIAAPQGTPIQATNNGIVVLAKYLNVTGNTIIIDHGLNLYSAYSHIEKIQVKEGDHVDKGSIIGTVGSTGFSTGPHLHWTISIHTTFINPWPLIENDPLAEIRE